MNRHILDQAVQEYIDQHLTDDVHRIAMAKSPFKEVESKELANQIAAKHKSQRKLPSWYQTAQIYYPALLSIEQCSSETTAQYKASLVTGGHLVDLTGGFGVDSLYFSKAVTAVTHCELDPELSAIAEHNAGVLGQNNITFLAIDGMKWLQEAPLSFDAIYIDPARRSNSGKVFMLKDCTPNVIADLDLLLSKSKKVMIKTSPLLDLSAGLKELGNVAEIHIVSTKNEVKELLWVLEQDAVAPVKIRCTTLNEQEKHFDFFKGEEDAEPQILAGPVAGYLYEPDAALLKSGAFNLIGNRYGLKKLAKQTQLYTADVVDGNFPGRIFKVNRAITAGELKKEKQLTGNVIVRNYRDKAENLVSKYKIKPDQHQFLLFTQSATAGFMVIDATIIQHY